MALRMNSITAVIHRTANLVAASSDYCCCFWYQSSFLSTTPTYITQVAHLNAGYTAWAGIFGNASVSAGETQISASDGGSTVGSPNTTIAVDTPAFLAYRRFGTTHQLMRNGFIVGTATLDISAVTFVDMVLGNDGFGVIDAPILFWDFKEWANSKSVSAMRTEMASYGFVGSLTTGLRAFTPLLNDLLDDSGNGNDWLGSGDYDFVANPALPTNVSAATATDIATLPFSETVPETYNLPLWYVRTALPGESYIGGYGFGGLGTYEPVALVWSGDGTLEWPIDAAWQTVSINAPFQTPVVPGEPIYFEFRSQFDGDGGQLVVSFLPEPTEDVPVGAILVTNEWPGYGAVLLDPTDGHVLQFRYSDFPSSDQGASLPDGSGRILVVASDSFYDSANLFLYESDLTLVLTLPFGTGSPIVAATVATSNRVDTFYLGVDPGSGFPSFQAQYVQRMSAIGVIDPTIFGPLPGTQFTAFNSIAVSPDETILYYRVDGNDLGAIHRWDLINNVAMTDLVSSPGLGWFAMGTLLTMPNGDIIGGWSQFLGGTAENIARYEPDGTLVWAWDSSAYQFDYHGVKTIAGPGYPDEIMVIGSLEGGHSVFITLDANTGVELSSFQVAQFELGAYAPGESASPETRFGASPSCFYFTMAEAIVEGQGIIGPLIWVEWPRRVIQ